MRSPQRHRTRPSFDRRIRNAIKELVKEGEIETVDGINYRLSDKGPSYPRF